MFKQTIKGVFLVIAVAVFSPSTHAIHWGWAGGGSHGVPAAQGHYTNFAHPQIVGMMMNPAFYAQFMNPATYGQFVSPRFWAQFMNPANMNAWMHPNAYQAFTNPNMYMQMMNPATYAMYMNPATYMQAMNPNAYMVLGNPNLYMQWANPATFEAFTRMAMRQEGEKGSGQNVFDPNHWAKMFHLDVMKLPGQGGDKAAKDKAGESKTN